MIIVDAHWLDAPYESEEWAATDRGWVLDTEHPDRDCYQGNLPIGNYLDYGPCRRHYREHPDGSVHACYTPWHMDKVTGTVIHTGTKARWCRDVHAAIAWIKEQHTGQKNLFS